MTVTTAPYTLTFTNGAHDASSNPVAAWKLPATTVNAAGSLDVSGLARTLTRRFRCLDCAHDLTQDAVSTHICPGDTITTDANPAGLPWAQHPGSFGLTVRYAYCAPCDMYHTGPCPAKITCGGGSGGAP